MSHPAFVLAVCAFGLMAALPRIFFRRDGKLNLRWWLTAAPFGLSMWMLVLGLIGWIQPAVAADSLAGEIMTAASVPLFVAASALVAATIASHKVPLALWHQHNDAPASIVTHGPYRAVRHPFYASFLLMQTASALLLPGVFTLGCLALGVVSMTVTARREEKNLLGSKFGVEYAAYLARTGRFVPRLLGTR